MVSHQYSAPPDLSDASACRSAALLLRADRQPTGADTELVLDLDGLLSAVSADLEADNESVPTSVRYAAVQLATHILRRSSPPAPRRRPDANEATSREADHATAVPFNQSIRLGRMG